MQKQINSISRDLALNERFISFSSGGELGGILFLLFLASNGYFHVLRTLNDICPGGAPGRVQNKRYSRIFIRRVALAFSGLPWQPRGFAPEESISVSGLSTVVVKCVAPKSCSREKIEGELLKDAGCEPRVA